MLIDLLESSKAIGLCPMGIVCTICVILFFTLNTINIYSKVNMVNRCVLLQYQRLQRTGNFIYFI